METLRLAALTQLHSPSFDEGGELTEAVRRKPYCVLLLDEIEKAHPVMVEKAPDEDDREVSLTVVGPTKVPAAVGGGSAEADASAATDDAPAEPGGALDQPPVEDPTDS